MADTVTIPTTDLLQLEHLVETLEEAAVDAHRMLDADDRGWAKLGHGDGTFDRATLRSTAKVARVMAIVDPLIRRAVNLRIAYVWGSGVTIGADPGDTTGGQDVNALVQAFLDDQAHTFAGAQACEERERALMTDGNVYLCLTTDPLTGRVQVRTIPDAQVDDILTNPQDADDPWFVRRTYTTTLVEATTAGTTTTRTVTRTVFYPALGHYPARRPRTIDGNPVEWDKPVLHVRVNRPSGSKYGTPDLVAAIPWARGYKEFLEDWAKLVKALSRFAFQATAKSGRGAAQVRDRLSAAAVTLDGNTPVGQTAIVAEGQRLEAVGKSGATIDSGSGRPLAAMVASATDLPVTMLTGDPGVTGARATAETLDKPLELIVRMRRDLDATVVHRVLEHVIDQAVKAPRGPLAGRVIRDPDTGREVIALANDQDRGIVVDWPSMEDLDLKTLIDAIVAADGTGYLPPEIVARLLLIALDVDNVDEVIDRLTDDDGNFVDPADAAAARSALAAVAAGAGTLD